MKHIDIKDALIRIAFVECSTSIRNIALTASVSVYLGILVFATSSNWKVALVLAPLFVGLSVLGCIIMLPVVFLRRYFVERTPGLLNVVMRSKYGFIDDNL